MPIKEGHGDLSGKTKALIVTEKSGYLGTLNFKPRGLRRPAELSSIHTSPRIREGNGKALVQAFIRNVGPGKITTTDVVHEETWETLRRLNLLRTAYNNEQLTVTDPQVLTEVIPITKFLEQSGVHVRGLNITYGGKKTLPSYDAIEAIHDRGDDHFIMYFQTHIDGAISPLSWIGSILKRRR